MSDKTIAAMTLALEALEYFRSTAICAADTDTANEAIVALREALAKEPTHA